MLPVYVCLVFLLLLFFIYYWTQRRMKQQDKMLNIQAIMEYLKITNQDEDVWNISARVNQQTNAAANQQSNWPTHDTHVSLDNFVLPSDYRLKDTRPPPPPYSELDLPSYEQATGCPLPKPDITPVHIASSRGENNPGPSR